MKTVLRVISMIVLTLGIIALGYIMSIRLFGIDMTSRAFELTMQEPEEASSEDVSAEKAEETEKLHWTISFIGDCTLASSQYNNDFINKVNGDYNYPFKNVAEIFKADDYTIANLECTFSDRVGLVSDGTFAFKAPSDYARILPAGGIDFVTTSPQLSFPVLVNVTVLSLSMVTVNSLVLGNIPIVPVISPLNTIESYGLYQGLPLSKETVTTVPLL